MDDETLRAYDRAAPAFAEEWESQPAPTDLHAIIRRHFIPGSTADIGCGSGRDAAWLEGHGWNVTGYDASDGLLAEARRRHPHLRLHKARLPELAGVAAGSFANVLCETVIMHLPPRMVAPAVRRLVDILLPGGVLYLSWRVEADARRDGQGRLYAAVDSQHVLGSLTETEVLLDEQVGSLSSGKLIQRIVARRHVSGRPCATGQPGHA